MTSPRQKVILRLTPHFHREGSWPVAFDPVGGLQIQTFALTKGLDQLGATQTVATSHIPGSPRRQPLGRHGELLSVGPSLPGFLAGSLLGFSWFIGVLGLLMVDPRRYDLIHIHFNHSVWCRVLLLLLGAMRRPVVVSLNTALWGGLRHALRLEHSRLDVTLWMERAALRRADRVVALTDGAAELAQTVVRIPRDRIAVIPDAVAVEDFRSSPDEHARRAFRLRHGIREDWRIVSYVGRISEEKGWHDLPHLVEGLAARRAFLLVCGDGPDRLRLANAFRRTSHAGSSAITGFLPPAAIREALKMTDVLILPSRREVFGSVLLEAMASGVPTVAYRVGGIVDVAGNPPAISLAAPGDTADLLRRILGVLDDAGERETLVARGHERVKGFAIARSVSLTEALYDDMLRARRRKAVGDMPQAIK